MTKVQIYLDDNNFYEYEVENQSKAREHCFRIQQQGYNEIVGNRMVYFPIHRIHKICFTPCDTKNDIIAKKYESNNKDGEIK